MNNSVYCAVGIPGCGKSTWWKLAKDQGLIGSNAIRVNMDDIRKDLTGDEGDQTQNAKVAQIARMNLHEALSNGVEAIYWDNTSALRKYRRDIVKAAKKANYKAVAVWFDLPFELCVERNEGRDRVVPIDVLERMYDSIQKTPPDYDEGWDDIIVIKVDNE